MVGVVVALKISSFRESRSLVAQHPNTCKHADYISPSGLLQLSKNIKDNKKTALFMTLTLPAISELKMLEIKRKGNGFLIRYELFILILLKI